MRPRPDAAENAQRQGGVVRRLAVASMRPRPDAAENAPARGAGRADRALASMRPRPDAAETRSLTYSPAMSAELQ